jgi:hypothetical protein
MLQRNLLTCATTHGKGSGAGKEMVEKLDVT